MATSNFYLYDSRCSCRTLIILHFRYNSQKLVFSTRQKALPKHWNQNRQRLKETSSCPEAKSINQVLNKIEVDINNIYRDLILNDLTPSNSQLKQRLKSKMKIDSTVVESAQNTELDFIEMVDKWIEDSVTGKRLKKDGTVIRKQTIKIYNTFRYHLIRFRDEKNFKLKLPLLNGASDEEYNKIKKYWSDFYLNFTDYLYKDCNNFDNAVGTKIKNLRVFLNYLSELGHNVGTFHHNFYVTSEDVAPIVLTLEQLSYLITDKDLESSLSSRLQRVKDIFVFGCTVSLRISDLLVLTDRNLQKTNGSMFLKVKSKKTGIESFMKLPDYTVDILTKYKGQYPTLLPTISDVKLNLYLKELGRLCRWNAPVIKVRSKRGQQAVVPKSRESEEFEFCDLLTTHVMRKTAITTMLRLGMPERIVKRISGHSPNSSTFYKYVKISEEEIADQVSSAFSNLTKNNL